mgnify:CR=1 FL=1
MIGRQSDPLNQFASRVQTAFDKQSRRIEELEKSISRISRNGLSQQANAMVHQAVTELQRREEHYTQVIMLAGYGAFFALWTQSRAEMSLWLFASTGTLICVSLLSFVGFELYKSWRFGAFFAPGKTPTVPEVNAEIDRINAPWRWVFFVSAGTGLLAGTSLLLWFVFKTIVSASQLI